MAIEEVAGAPGASLLFLTAFHLPQLARQRITYCIQVLLNGDKVGLYLRQKKVVLILFNF